MSGQSQSGEPPLDEHGMLPAHMSLLTAPQRAELAGRRAALASADETLLPQESSLLTPAQRIELAARMGQR